MPTKKRRVGFIPRNDVLEIIYKLSFESNLSNSKIINILVEEALYKRGLLIMEKRDGFYSINYDNLENTDKSLKDTFLNNKNSYNKETKEDVFESDIYDKFLMFLKFRERIKKSNL